MTHDSIQKEMEKVVFFFFLNIPLEIDKKEKI